MMQFPHFNNNNTLKRSPRYVNLFQQNCPIRCEKCTKTKSSDGRIINYAD